MIGRKGQSQWLILVAVGALVLIALQSFGFFSGAGIAAPAGAPATTTAFCPDSSVTMTLGPATKWRSPSTAVTDEYHRLYVSGVDQGLKKDGSTVSVRVAKTNGEANDIVLYYAENSSFYYAAESKFSVPCGAFDSASLSGGKHILGNHSADITFNFFNSDDGDLNSVTNNVSIASGEEVSYTAALKGTSDETFSPYGDVIVVVDYNDTEFDVSKITLDGGTKTAVPSIHTLLNTGFKSTAWKIPGGPDPSTAASGRWTYNGDLTVKARSGVDPVHSNALSFFNWTMYSEDFAQDPDSAVEIFGAENNRGTRIGFSPSTTVLRYS